MGKSMKIIYNFLHISSQCLITFLGNSMITVISNNLQVWEQSATVQVQSTSRAPNTDWHFVVHFRPAPTKTPAK